MFGNIEVMSMAHLMAVHAGTRQSVIAQNVANADTPGYRANEVSSFAETYENPGLSMRATRSGHITTPGGPNAPRIKEAEGRESPNGNTVTLEREMMSASAARQQHDMALSIYQTSLDILRTSIGRR